MKYPGYKEIKGKQNIPKPVEIEDLELAWKSDREGKGLYIFQNFDENAFEYIKKFNPKFIYSPKGDGYIKDEIPNLKRVKIGEFEGPRGTSPFYVLEGKLGNQKVIVFAPDPVWGGGDVVLTQKESPELVKITEDYFREPDDSYNSKEKQFSFFSNIKEQLSDAPVEVKKAFNGVVNYFDGKYQKSSSVRVKDLKKFLDKIDDEDLVFIDTRGHSIFTKTEGSYKGSGVFNIPNE